MTEHDPVNHPTHYASEAKCSGCGEPIECIDVARHMGFDQGNALKYLWRAGKKDALVQDLKKAIWYIEDMIAEAEGKKNPNVHRLSKGGAVPNPNEDEPGWALPYIQKALREEFEKLEQERKKLNELPIGLAKGITKESLEENIQHDRCEYTFDQDTYMCMTHGMKESKHHPREGANRPCWAIDPE